MRRTIIAIAMSIASLTSAYAGEIVSHPPGCPRVAFCGCGAAVEVFGGNGREHRELWPASAWFAFAPTTPAPGMVAVRPHHVFVIRRVLDALNVIAYDANSGSHLTRVHEVSLRGYSVRDPRSPRTTTGRRARYSRERAPTQAHIAQAYQRPDPLP